MGLLFTYLMTYGGAALALFRPYYGFLVYVAFAIIKPEALWHWSVPAGNYSRIIAVAVLTGWAVNGFGNWNFRGVKAPLFCLLGYLTWMAFSTTFAPESPLAWASVENKAKIFVPLIAALTLARSMDDVWKLGWVIMLSTGYVALEYNRHYYNGGDYDRFLQVDANSVSILLLTGCGLAFFCGLNRKTGWKRWLLFFAAALIAHVPMAGMSRGGMLGVVGMGIVSFFLMQKTVWNLAFYALAVAGILFLAGPSVMHEFDSTFTDQSELEDTKYGRIYMWQSCFQEMMKNPLFGCGQDRWGDVAPNYGYPPGKEAHSIWATTAAELGVPGILFLVGFYVTTFHVLWRQSRAVEDQQFRSIAQMVMVGLIGFVIPASFVSSEGVEIPYYTATIGLAAVKLRSQAQTSLPAPWTGPLAYHHNPYPQPFMHRGH